MQGTFRALAVAGLATLALSSAASAASYDAHTVIVKFAPGVSAAQQAAALGGAPVVQTIHGLGAQVVRVSGDPAVVAASLNRSALVQYAEVNKILRATATPNDPSFSQEYGLAKISAPAGWDLAGLGAFPNTGGVKVGIVDTGILKTHEDLAGKVADCAQSRGLGGILSGSIQKGSRADDHRHRPPTPGPGTPDTHN